MSVPSVTPSGTVTLKVTDGPDVGEVTVNFKSPRPCKVEDLPKAVADGIMRVLELSLGKMDHVKPLEEKVASLDKALKEVQSQAELFNDTALQLQEQNLKVQSTNVELMNENESLKRKVHELDELVKAGETGMGVQDEMHENLKTQVEKLTSERQVAEEQEKAAKMALEESRNVITSLKLEMETMELMLKEQSAELTKLKTSPMDPSKNKKGR